MNIQVVGEEIWADGERVGTLDRQHRYADDVKEKLEAPERNAANELDE